MFSIIIVIFIALHSIVFTAYYGEVSFLEHDSMGWPNGDTFLHVASTTYVLANEAPGWTGMHRNNPVEFILSRW